MKQLWQNKYQRKILEILEQHESVQAIILKGSCANSNIEIDAWSDIDLLVIVNDENINDFFPDVSWILPLGRIFGLEQSISKDEMGSRICLEDFARFDIVFVKKSVLNSVEKWQKNLFGEINQVLFSKIKNIETIIAKAQVSKKYTKSDKFSFEKFTQGFWFLGVTAIKKIIRGDYLIAGHLALEMAQNCIVLQMMIRDLEKGTNVHRTGGHEDIAILEKLIGADKLQTPDKIFRLIEESAIVFDRLAYMFDKSYTKRFELFKMWIMEAREYLN